LNSSLLAGQSTVDVHRYGSSGTSDKLPTTGLSRRHWHAVLIDEDGPLSQRGGLPPPGADENHRHDVGTKLQQKYRY
jgi:hypothetical protein